MVGPNDNSKDVLKKISRSGADLAAWVPTISIGAAARLLNLSVSALRKYENEGLIVYHRTPGARRLLAPADIDRIRQIQALLGKGGLNMEGIRRLVALIPCWDLMPCSADDRQQCNALHDSLHPCWMTSATICARKGLNCRECRVYRHALDWLPMLKTILHDPAARNSAATDSFKLVVHP